EPERHPRQQLPGRRVLPPVELGGSQAGGLPPAAERGRVRVVVPVVIPVDHVPDPAGEVPVHPGGDGLGPIGRGRADRDGAGPTAHWRSPPYRVRSPFVVWAPNHVKRAFPLATVRPWGLVPGPSSPHMVSPSS